MTLSSLIKPQMLNEESLTKPQTLRLQVYKYYLHWGPKVYTYYQTLNPKP